MLPSTLYKPSTRTPLLQRMPRRLTPLDEALASYLGPDSTPGTLEFDMAPIGA